MELSQDAESTEPVKSAFAFISQSTSEPQLAPTAATDQPID